MSRINEMCRLIQKDGKIDKIDLVMKARISIAYFEKLKPFLLKIHQDKIRYNREEKLFEALIPLEN